MEITVYVVTKDCCGEFEAVFGSEDEAEAFVKQHPIRAKYSVDSWSVTVPSE